MIDFPLIRETIGASGLTTAQSSVVKAVRSQQPLNHTQVQQHGCKHGPQ